MKTIKTICTILLLSLLSGKALANFTGAKLKVTGVTCSMCSNSVHKALSSLSFVDKINVDLENAVFELTFKPNEKVVIDDVRKKVEGAGFSVGELTADFNFNNVDIKKDYHYQFEGNTYHFVNVPAQNLDKCITIKFVDKGLTSNKEYKRYVGLTNYECIKTGKSQGCCNSAISQRIYHVTL
jgi:copper chaperone CopZ